MDQNKRYHQLREAGLCPWCGGDRQNSGILLCPDCRKKSNERSSRYNKGHRGELPADLAVKMKELEVLRELRKNLDIQIQVLRQSIKNIRTR